MTTPSYVFLYADYSMQCDSGLHIAYDRNGQNISAQAGVIQWGDIKVPPCFETFEIGKEIIAHELGHNLRLGHHDTTDALMTQGWYGISDPTYVDIGPTPPCNTGTNGWGVRCI